MKLYALIALPTVLSLVLLAHTASVSAPPVERDRSPSDLALSPDTHWALTANTTADSVSLVDLEQGKVAAEVSVGKHPFAIAFTKDGKRAVVTNWLSNSISVLAVSPPNLKVVETIPVGDEPRGVALSPDGTKAYVALGGENVVAWVDLAAKKVTARIPVGTEPWHVALTPNGKRLAVGNVRSMDMSLLDTMQKEVVQTIKMRGHNIRHIAISPNGDWGYVPHISERGRPTTRENIDIGWVIGNRLSRFPLQEEGPKESIALDTRGKAVGDVDGMAVSPDGRSVVVSAAGTHELLSFRMPLPFVAFGGPADHIDSDLLHDSNRFRRIPLGGRPLGLAFRPDGKSVVVANYLLNALQVVNLESGEITRTIGLGGPSTPSLARQGEAIFYDAQRSFNQWYSCSTCHVEGHTNGSNFDTFNDGSYDTPKKTLSLRGVTKTGPWTWHGWRKSLRDLAHDSFTKSMQGPEPSEADLEAMLAFLGTLDFKPSPYRNPDGSLTTTAKRGEAVFQAKACQTCHAAPNYTTEAVYKVGLESPEDVYIGFNPPSLRGVYNRSPYLHTGEARSLEEVLTKFHRPSQLTNKPDFTPQELADILVFLKSL